MISFDPNLPADRSPLSSAEMRRQLNALQAQIAALQEQLAPLAPVLNRDANGVWTLTFAGPEQDMWQLWARYNGSETWSNQGEMSSGDFPAHDGDVLPDGASWCQVKFCGEGDYSKQTTAFSNIVSVGPVP